MTFISQTSLSRATPDFLVPGVTIGVGVSEGDWVYLDSSSVAQRALADASSTSNVFGLVESVSGSTATIRVGGISSELFAGLDTTKEYLLSNATLGGMNPEGVSVPTATGHVVLVLGKPYNSSRFLVRVGSRIIRS